MSVQTKRLEFEARFATKYGREITPEEEKYMSLAAVVLGEDLEPEPKICIIKSDLALKSKAA